jgi:hypothetical protein
VKLHRHSGAMRSIEPQMCNCTSGNLKVPGSRYRAPRNDVAYFFK